MSRMSSALSTAEDAVNDARLIIRALRLTLEAVPIDERRKLVRQLEEYGGIISIIALMDLQTELSGASDDLGYWSHEYDDEKPAAANSISAETATA